MNHKGTITLETKLLILRRLTINDAPSMLRNWASDDEVTKYLTWPTHTDVSVSEDIINSWLPLYDKPEYYHWTIILKELGEPIGTIGAVEQREDIKMMHIGYCIGRKWWNKGITSEALRELIRFFFEDVGVNRIESRHDPRNPNSGKVMIKCGLKYEGTMRQSDVNNQGICDAAYYVLLAEEYFTQKAKSQQTTIAYQPYTTAHLDGVLLLSQEWHDENITFGVVPDTAEDVASYQNEYFHVALDGKRVVGYATAEIINDNEYGIFPCGADYLRINDVYVAKEYRSHGIGERLLNIIEQKADENSMPHIFLTSATKDAEAIQRFYLRNGYTIWATRFFKRKGWDVRTYPLNDLDYYRFVVIFARYQDKWLYCRAKERDTFETAGGHIEKGETPFEAAKRELFEETGAVKFDIRPAFDYSVHTPEEYSNGQVYLADVCELGEMPGFEMVEVKLFDKIPDKMRFPQILPVLFEKVREMVCS